MSLSEEIDDLALRVAQEFNNVRESAYTKEEVEGLVVAAQGPPGPEAKMNPLWGKLRAALSSRNTRPVPIVFCGSSSIAGTGASEEAKRWVNVLTEAIKASYVSTNMIAMRTLAAAVSAMPLTAGIQGVNAGVAGAYADGYLSSATAAQVGSLNPLVVIHMITSNDYAGDRDPVNKTMVDINTRINWINDAVTSGIVPLHILIHPFKRGDVTDVGKVFPWSDYQIALKNFVRSRTDSIYVDAGSFFDGIGVPTDNTLGVLEASLVHLTDAGHAMLADIVRTAFEIPTAPQAAVASTNPVVVLDTFNRSDGALGNADTGQAWATGNGAATVAGSKLSVASTAMFTGTVDSGKTNVDVSVDFVWQGQVTSIVFRSDVGTGNRISLTAASATTLRCYSTIAGTTSVVNPDVVMTSLVVGTTYTLRGVLNGTTLQGYLNGSLIGTWTIPTDLNNATQYQTRYGLRVASTGSVARTFDNFVVKSI